MDSEKVIEELTSKDPHKIWQASNEVIKYSQSYKDIEPLIDRLSVIEESTKGIELGGALAPNKRFLDKAVEVIKLHKESKKCPCQLYTGGYYDGFNPKKELEKNNISIITDKQGFWEADYVVRCLKCEQEYDVIERNGHYTWWHWTKK